MAGVSQRKSTARNGFYRLRQLGLAEDVSGGCMRASADAIARYGDAVPVLPSGDELIADMRQKLGGAPLRLFEALVEAGGEIQVKDAGRAADINPGTSTLRNAVHRLRTHGIASARRGVLRASPLIQVALGADPAEVVP